MIPLLIVSGGRQELTDLANDLGDAGAADGLMPFVAEDAEGAIDAYKQDELGLRLMLTVLHPHGQEAYDALKEEGYMQKFRVAGPETLKDGWGDRNVEFLDLAAPGDLIYQTVMDDILY